MKKIFLLSIIFILTSTNHASAQNTMGTENNSKSLENLLLCKIKNKITKKNAEMAFKDMQLVKNKEEIYTPKNGNSPEVFGAKIIDASFNNESDQTTISATVIDIGIEQLAQKLEVKKHRMNGPFGPEMMYIKHTSKNSTITITPSKSSQNKSINIECAVH